MNKLITKMLREAEDSSDDFFRSKHIIKRKKYLERKFARKKRDVYQKLINGLQEIKASYESEAWRDDREKLFLEIFSMLHINNEFYQNEYMYGYYLLDKNFYRECFCNLMSDQFWIDYGSIWWIFKRRFFMEERDVKLFMTKMLKEYFKLDNVEAVGITGLGNV